MKVLGISGSLRNARCSLGSELLKSEICMLKDEKALYEYLMQQTKIRADEFLAAGMDQGIPFDEVYRNLQKEKSERGLSNSEAALAASLWGCVQEGADIHHVGLAQYFPMNGSSKDLDKLKQLVLESDALLISGPVYFGDRSSLIQSFVEFLTSDTEITRHLNGKLYAGVSVGAKRNGGQETQLIYQMIDMANLNMLALGNSAETTSQYGGTVVAGDIGTAWKDEYGVSTSIGTGKRLASIGVALEKSRSLKLKDKVKIGIWLVQDDDKHTGRKYLENIVANNKAENTEIAIIDVTEEEVYRCIACDLCPTHHAHRSEYACIIKKKSDFFVKKHAEIMDVDAILLASYSPVKRGSINSVYQKFIERTRYIRRGSYMWGNRLVAPFVISELDANQNLHIRMLTSLIRHHTVLHHPIIGFEYQGKILNMTALEERYRNFIHFAEKLTLARLARDHQQLDTTYNPIGYTISARRDSHAHESGQMGKLQDEKSEQHNQEQSLRLKRTGN